MISYLESGMRIIIIVIYITKESNVDDDCNDDDGDDDDNGADVGDDNQPLRRQNEGRCVCVRPYSVHLPGPEDYIA